MGEMKVELSHTRAQIEQMMGMMQQLLQAKSADGGQQKEKSGGIGRRDANDDSGGAGKAPRDEGAAGPRVAAATATAAGRRVSNHCSKMPDKLRLADDTGRRPEVPASVNPMMNMQRNESRHSFLAGIAASGFQRQPYVVPPVSRRERGGFRKFKHEFLSKANMLDISGHFVGQGTRVVPVGGTLKQKAVLLREGFSGEEIRGAYQAWNYIDGALQSEADRSILKRCKSTR